MDLALPEELQARVNELIQGPEDVDSIKRVIFCIDNGGFLPPFVAAMLNRAAQHIAKQNQSSTHFLFELLQNADDNIYENGVIPILSFELFSPGECTGLPGELGAAAQRHGCFVVRNNERGFRVRDLKSICSIGASSKENIPGLIGEKGIGFKSVFVVSDRPHIISGRLKIHFSKDPSPEIGLCYVVPHHINPQEASQIESWLLSHSSDPDLVTQTHFLLPIASPELFEYVQQALDKLSIQDVSFLRQLRVLDVRTTRNARRRITLPSPFDSGVVAAADMTGTISLCAVLDGGSEEGKVTHFAICKMKAHVPYEEVLEPQRSKPEQRQPDVTVFLPLDLDRIEASVQMGKLYAYLPTEYVPHIPFTISSDFILSPSRDNIIWENAWNKFLLRRCALAFCTALEALAQHSDATLRSDTILFSLIPSESRMDNIMKKLFLQPLMANLRTRRIVRTIDGALVPPNLGHYASANQMVVLRDDILTGKAPQQCKSRIMRDGFPETMYTNVLIAVGQHRVQPQFLFKLISENLDWARSHYATGNARWFIAALKECAAPELQKSIVKQSKALSSSPDTLCPAEKLARSILPLVCNQHSGVFCDGSLKETIYLRQQDGMDAQMLAAFPMLARVVDPVIRDLILSEEEVNDDNNNAKLADFLIKRCHVLPAIDTPKYARSLLLHLVEQQQKNSGNAAFREHLTSVAWALQQLAIAGDLQRLPWDKILIPTKNNELLVPISEAVLPHLLKPYFPLLRGPHGQVKSVFVDKVENLQPSDQFLAMIAPHLLQKIFETIGPMAGHPKFPLSGPKNDKFVLPPAIQYAEEFQKPFYQASKHYITMVRLMLQWISATPNLPVMDFPSELSWLPAERPCQIFPSALIFKESNPIFKEAPVLHPELRPLFLLTGEQLRLRVRFASIADAKSTVNYIDLLRKLAGPTDQQFAAQVALEIITILVSSYSTMASHLNIMELRKHFTSKQLIPFRDPDDYQRFRWLAVNPDTMRCDDDPLALRFAAELQLAGIVNLADEAQGTPQMIQVFLERYFSVSKLNYWDWIKVVYQFAKSTISPSSEEQLADIASLYNRIFSSGHSIKALLATRGMKWLYCQGQWLSIDSARCINREHGLFAAEVLGAYDHLKAANLYADDWNSVYSKVMYFYDHIADSLGILRTASASDHLAAMESLFKRSSSPSCSKEEVEIAIDRIYRIILEDKINVPAPPRVWCTNGQWVAPANCYLPPEKYDLSEAASSVLNIASLGSPSDEDAIMRTRALLAWWKVRAVESLVENDPVIETVPLPPEDAAASAAQVLLSREFPPFLFGLLKWEFARGDKSAETTTAKFNLCLAALEKTQLVLVQDIHRVWKFKDANIKVKPEVKTCAWLFNNKNQLGPRVPLFLSYKQLSETTSSNIVKLVLSAIIVEMYGLQGFEAKFARLRNMLLSCRGQFAHLPNALEASIEFCKEDIDVESLGIASGAIIPIKPEPTTTTTAAKPGSKQSSSESPLQAAYDDDCDDNRFENITFYNSQHIRLEHLIDAITGHDYVNPVNGKTGLFRAFDENSPLEPENFTFPRSELARAVGDLGERIAFDWVVPQYYATILQADRVVCIKSDTPHDDRIKFLRRGHLVARARQIDGNFRSGSHYDIEVETLDSNGSAYMTDYIEVKSSSSKTAPEIHLSRQQGRFARACEKDGDKSFKVIGLFNVGKESVHAQIITDLFDYVADRGHIKVF